MILQGMHRPSARTQSGNGLHGGLGAGQCANEWGAGRDRCRTNTALIGVATLSGWRVDDQRHLTVLNHVQHVGATTFGNLGNGLDLHTKLRQPIGGAVRGDDSEPHGTEIASNAHHPFFVAGANRKEHGAFDRQFQARGHQCFGEGNGCRTVQSHHLTS